MTLKLVPSDEKGRKALEEANMALSAFREAGIQARLVQPVYKKPYVVLLLLKITQKQIEQNVHEALEEQGISYSHKTKH